MPWFAIIFCAILAVFNLHFFLGNPVPPFWWFFACDRQGVMIGEYWRLLSLALPHLGIQHLLEDIAYLLVVGALAENTIGRMTTIITFFLCCLAGSLSFVIWDTRYAFLVGSSDGTHGLLACVAIWIFLSCRSIPMRILSLVVVGYLFYTSVYAIYHGVMGWPLTMLPNGGYDHLGGVSMGVLLGVVKYALDRSRAPSTSISSQPA